MARNNRNTGGDCPISGCGEIFLVGLLAVNAMGGLALNEAINTQDALSHGDIAKIAVMAVCDLVVLSAAAYKIYKCATGSQSPRRRSLQMGLLNAAAAPKNDDDASTAAVEALEGGIVYS